MIHYYRINDEGRVEAVASAAEATWIHLESSSEELLQSFADTYSFPSDYLTSTLDPDEVSRAENLHQKGLDLPVLLLLLYPVAEGDKGSGCFITETISIVLLDKLVITSARNTPGFFQDLRDNRYDLVRDLQDSRGIVIEIAWRIAKSFVEASRVVRGTMDQLQEELSKSTRSEHLLRWLIWIKVLFSSLLLSMRTGRSWRVCRTRRIFCPQSETRNGYTMFW